jgi:hypothetical protein
LNSAMHYSRHRTDASVSTIAPDTLREVQGTVRVATHNAQPAQQDRRSRWLRLQSS